jgi:hypothetical protein
MNIILQELMSAPRDHLEAKNRISPQPVAFQQPSTTPVEPVIEEPSLISQVLKQLDAMAADEAVKSPSQESPPGSYSSEEDEKTIFHDSSELGEQVSTGAEATSQLHGPETGQTDPVLPSAGYITYSCLLVPRMPQHLLTSNLASYL